MAVKVAREVATGTLAELSPASPALIVVAPTFQVTVTFEVEAGVASGVSPPIH